MIHFLPLLYHIHTLKAIVKQMNLRQTELYIIQQTFLKNQIPTLKNYDLHLYKNYIIYEAF